MKFKSLIILLLAKIIFCETASLGEPCTKYNGLPGICKLAQFCQNSQIFIKIDVDMCDSYYGKKVVCCTKSDAASAKTKSEQNCMDYEYLTTKRVESGALDLWSTPTISYHPDCKTSAELVVGGEDAVIGEFPHSAALGYIERGEPKFSCGGSLISEKFILTASHCRGGRFTFARLGYTNLFSSSYEDQGRDYNIKTFIQHPNYSARLVHHDIALIELSESVEFSKTIRPACLYFHDYKVKEDALTAIGWGSVDPHFHEPSNVLQKVALNISRNPQSCQKKINSRVNLNPPLTLIREQLCAYGGPGKDTCGGDSGGPLQITRTNDCVFYIAGVTSHGIGCATDLPAVYTRVHSYLNWIERIVWP